MKAAKVGRLLIAFIILMELESLPFFKLPVALLDEAVEDDPQLKCLFLSGDMYSSPLELTTVAAELYVPVPESFDGDFVSSFEAGLWGRFISDIETVDLK